LINQDVVFNYNCELTGTGNIPVYSPCYSPCAVSLFHQEA